MPGQAFIPIYVCVRERDTRERYKAREIEIEREHDIKRESKREIAREKGREKETEKEGDRGGEGREGEGEGRTRRGWGYVFHSNMSLV